MTWVLLCEALARSIPGGSNLCATSPTWSCLAPLGQGLVPWSKGQSPYVWCLVVSVPIILLVDCNHWPLLKATLSLCQCRSVPKRLELVWAWCTYQTPAIPGDFYGGYTTASYTGVNLRYLTFYLFILWNRSDPCGTDLQLADLGYRQSIARIVEMSVAGLRFGSGRSSTAPLENKSGSYIYHRDAAHYHDWEFRTLLRIKLFDSKKECRTIPNRKEFRAPLGRTLKLKLESHLTRAQAAKTTELQPLPVQALKGMTLAETGVP